MSNILFHSPGQTVTLVIETLDSVGHRADGYSLPEVVRIIFPNLSLASGYPQFMTKLDVGLYTFKFTLPANAASIGTYIIDIIYASPILGTGVQTFFQVVVTAPFGQYTVSTF